MYLIVELGRIHFGYTLYFFVIMKKILFAFLVLFLASCNEPKVVSPTDYYEVTFLFEVEGIKVYRFDDDGRYVYLTTKGDVSREFVESAGRIPVSKKQQTISE